MLVQGPLELASVTDLEQLRREITTAQGRIGQASGARKEGNNRKRLRLRLKVPGYGATDVAQLAIDLARPSDSTTNQQTAPEVTDALTAADRSANRRGAGQGMRLSHADRTAIELHSVALASAHLTKEGYTVKDVGAVASYDLDAVRPGEHLYVEVKGTTSPGEEIILTRREVELIDAEHPHTMLIVVSGIHLDRSHTPPSASGGTIRVTHPWQIQHRHLTPVSYRYRIS